MSESQLDLPIRLNGGWTPAAVIIIFLGLIVLVGAILDPTNHGIYGQDFLRSNANRITTVSDKLSFFSAFDLIFRRLNHTPIFLIIYDTYIYNVSGILFGTLVIFAGFYAWPRTFEITSTDLIIESRMPWFRSPEIYDLNDIKEIKVTDNHIKGRAFSFLYFINKLGRRIAIIPFSALAKKNDIDMPVREFAIMLGRSVNLSVVFKSPQEKGL